MKKITKHHYLLVAFGVILFAALMKFGVVLGFIKNVFSIISPVLIGFLIAFILNVPTKGYEKLLKKLTSNSKKPPKDKPIQVLSLFLSIISVLLVLFLVFWLVIPAVAESIVNLYHLAMKKLPEWIELLKAYDINTESITKWLESLNIEELIKKISSNAGYLITSVVGFAGAAVSGISSFAMSFIISIYVLLCKRDLSRQVRKLSKAHLSPHVEKYLFHVGNLVSNTYSKFLSGQCVEACILGFLIFLAFTIFSIPYASLIGVLTTVLAFIPFVGSFLSCFIGAFLVLIADPSKVIVAIIVYLVVQFIENQFIYPHVVGTSVGLSSLWTLVAVLVGGNLFGVLGMIFFIPIMAVFMTLLKEHTNYVLEKKYFPDNDEDNFEEFVEEMIPEEVSDGK